MQVTGNRAAGCRSNKPRYLLHMVPRLPRCQRVPLLQGYRSCEGIVSLSISNLQIKTQSSQ
jgi:hypothetical protein